MHTREQFLAELEKALQALRLAGEHILNLSNQRVPLEEGTLERSGVVTDDGKGAFAIVF